MGDSLFLLLKYIGPFVLIFILVLVKRNYNKQVKKKFENSIEDFKKDADRVKVNLRHAEINSVVYGEKIEYDHSTFQEKTINHLFFNKPYQDNGNDIYQNTHRNTLTLRGIKYKDFEIDYREELIMDKDKLKTWVVFHEETYLYINKNNIEDMYLDLSFME